LLFAWAWNLLASPKNPRNRAIPAARLTIELTMVVVTPTDSIRVLTWSAGSERVMNRDTTLLTVRMAKAAMINVHA